jgi:hypothetical protein
LERWDRFYAFRRHHFHQPAMLFHQPIEAFALYGEQFLEF